MRILRLLLVAALAAVTVAADPAPPATPTARAGAAVIDASWHVGASGGQFSEDEPPFGEDHADPHWHSTKKRPSYGLGSRSSVRALVVEGSDGDKVAIVSHDLYLPQDLLTRRIAQLVEERTGIPADHVAVTASHNHNTPYYSTPGWGTAIFQDVFDLRFFGYMAERAAQAVVAANEQLVPVTMGGTTTTFNEVTSHTYGPKVADDGTPAGQPYDHTTGELTVVRFDSATSGAPVATWVVFGVHPEWTWGYDLINGDINHATMRIVDREVGGVTVWSGREIGTSGPHKDERVHEAEERREYQDNGFAQMDRAARLLADAIATTRDSIATGDVERADRYAPMTSDFDVAAVSQRFAPPATRPYPGVSNCNTHAFFHGDPRVPILGLPDCESVPTGGAGEVISPYTSQLYDQLKQLGVPVPESISPTKLTAVEETAAVHLMAMKLGDIGITFCPCEEFTDTALNIESRIDRVDGQWHGWDWAAQRTPTGRDWCVSGPGADEWTCADPRDPSVDLAPVSDLAYRRMRAQIGNDAAGWETDLATLGSEAEPVDPDLIKGNFTHEEFTAQGFGLPIAVGMANDYWGYVPEYREYRSHDHYRKALSGLGPHGADFLATRLARLAVSLNDAELQPESRPLDLAYQAESARAEVVARALGELAVLAEQAYRATVPAGPTPAIAEQPTDVERFGAAFVTWTGPSNYRDIPEVRVERETTEGWVTSATTEGEVQVMLDLPDPDQAIGARLGQHEWRWTASFEAFSSDVVLPDATGEPQQQTPAATYRFVIPVAGEELVSEPFEVRPFAGIEVADIRLEPDHRVSVALPDEVDFPDSYTSPFRYIVEEWRELPEGSGVTYCSFCSFRPWADRGTVEAVTLTIVRANGRTETVAMARGSDGRWYAPVTLRPNESAYVDVGGARYTFGEANVEPSPTVTRAPRG